MDQVSELNDSELEKQIFNDKVEADGCAFTDCSFNNGGDFNECVFNGGKVANECNFDGCTLNSVDISDASGYMNDCDLVACNGPYDFNMDGVSCTSSLKDKDRKMDTGHRRTTRYHPYSHDIGSTSRVVSITNQSSGLPELNMIDIGWWLLNGILGIATLGTYGNAFSTNNTQTITGNTIYSSGVSKIDYGEPVTITSHDNTSCCISPRPRHRVEAQTIETGGHVFSATHGGVIMHMEGLVNAKNFGASLLVDGHKFSEGQPLSTVDGTDI